MKLLHIADVHLGASYSGFGDLARSRSDEVLDAFRRLPDVAAEERVDAVLFAGDLFDGPQPPRTAMAAVRDTLRRLVDLCVPVFLVPGNHDATTLRLDPYRELARGSRVVVQTELARDRSWPIRDEQGQRLADKHRTYILAAPRFGEPVRVETDAGPLCVYGVAYDVAECRAPFETFRRAEDEGVHVALVHASALRADHWGSSGNALTTTPRELAALDVDYIALGDHHRPTLPDEFDGAPACYPGSFAALDSSEIGPRGYVVATLSADSAPRVVHHDAGVAQVVHAEVEVSALPDDVRVAEAAAARVPDRSVPHVRLVGEPAFPLDADAVETELVERFGHAVVTDDTRFYASSRLDEIAELDTVAGHVVRLGRSRIETAGEDLEVAQRALRAALRALGVQ